MINGRQNLDFLDLFKFGLILMVLAIHAPLSSGIRILGCDVLPPILRMAVPLFFLMSSYFFFSKLALLDEGDRRNAVIRFAKRNMLLYLFWFVVLLPVTIYVRWNWWFGHGVIRGFLTFLFNFFINGTFCASWFLTALVISMLLVLLLSRKLRTRWLILLGGGGYVLAVFCSCYSGVLETHFPFLRAYPLYRAIVLSLPTSFVSAFVWISLGKFMSESRCFFSQYSTSAKGLVLGIALLLYFTEVIIVKYYVGGNGGNDCYFLLVPVCSFLFCIVKDIGVRIPHSRLFREMSTVLYVLHASVFVVIDVAFRRFAVFDSSHLLKFSLGLVVCLMVYAFLKRISEQKFFSWIEWGL